MKHFKEFIQWCCEPQRLFVLFIVVLAIPNVALFFTEQQMTLWARICNVILPVSVYWLIMTLGRKPGKTIWILFPFVFFAAFQLVLLYLFGRSIIAVDMFLNLTTTNYLFPTKEGRFQRWRRLSFCPPLRDGRCGPMRGALPLGSKSSDLAPAPHERALRPAPRPTFSRRESRQRYARNLLVPGPPAQGGGPPWIPPPSALAVLAEGI